MNGIQTNPLNKLISGVKNLIENYNEVEKRANLDFMLMELYIKLMIFLCKKDQM